MALLNSAFTLYNTFMALHHSTRLYITLPWHYFTLLARLYITLPWIYFTLLDPALLYHGSTRLYIIQLLLYFTLLDSI